MAAVAPRLRPAGWLVFDLHTDAMMDFTIANPVVAGESAGNDFVISSVVDPGARTCDTTIELTRPRDGDPFSEQHRQYFHADAEVRACLRRRGLRGDRGQRGVHAPAGGRLDPARDLDRAAPADATPARQDPRRRRAQWTSALNAISTPPMAAIATAWRSELPESARPTAGPR